MVMRMGSPRSASVLEGVQVCGGETEAEKVEREKQVREVELSRKDN